MIAIDRILVPTDFSDNNRPALKLACELARRFSSDLFLLSVVEPTGGLQPLPRLPDNVRLDLLGDSAYVRAERLLATLPSPAESKEIRVHRHVEIGHPADVVLQYAKAHDIDLIVPGCKGMTGMARLLLGSVAQKIVRHAKCPVLTVPSPQMNDKVSESNQKADRHD